MNERKKRGDQGEAAVAAALEQRGYRVLGRQYRCRWGEIDLIAQAPDGVLCFVEVKTRAPDAIAPGREAVTPAKQRRLRNAAAWFLAQTELDCPCRFDVAEVSGPRINYIKNAFQ